MQIISYTKIQLQGFIDDEFFKVLSKIPITYHRAVSQVNNPYASDEDVLLWAAYEKASLVGYVGVLPDLISLENNKRKIYWLSCFWIDESFRNNNLASQLFFLLLRQYKNQLYISNFLFSLENIYQNLGIFKPTQYLIGSTFYLRFCFAPLVQARYANMKLLVLIYGFIERSLNVIMILKKLFTRKVNVKIKLEENCTLDDELEHFISYFSSTNKKVVRNIQHFNWILTYPWVLNGKSDLDSSRYYFTSKAAYFEHRTVKFYLSNKLSGFVFLTLKNKSLKVCYIYANDECVCHIADYLISCAEILKLNEIIVYDNQLIKHLKIRRGKFLYVRNIKQAYIFPENDDITASVFQFGDGDAVFT